MSLLQGLRVVQLGSGSAAAVCGRFFADAGASVTTIGPSSSDALAQFLNQDKTIISDFADAVSSAELIVCEGPPRELCARRYDADSLRRLNGSATIAFISGFGQSGPRADEPATDLTLFCASGLARLLTGQVDDISEPPIRPVGQQSAFVGGLAAACAAMAAMNSQKAGAIIDVSIQEALATLAVGELAQGGLTGRRWSRKRLKDGNGATVTILPARDGYVAISPREDRQWARWLEAMGSPNWASEPRFEGKSDRVENWDELHALMSEWSRCHDKQWIADAAQSAHVPSFPLGELSEHLISEQLRYRDFFKSIDINGHQIKAPGPPYRLAITEADRKPRDTRQRITLSTNPSPLDGIRVLDFSWVIAGPTATRHLAALGAEVIKVEAPGHGDPARGSHLHTVLAQGKKGIVLNLKNKHAVDIAKSLVAKSDVLIENFATGVMDRLGLDRAALEAANPGLIYLSASGLGRTGPEADKVAYGTLLQSYAGFAGLNRHPDKAPRVGFAWLDPMCGLMLPFVIAAAAWRRQRSSGQGVRIDFSMIEAMLWTLAEPVMATQLDAIPEPAGNLSQHMAPHGVYPCAGDDQWIGLVVRSCSEWQQLCALVPELSAQSQVGLAERLAMHVYIDSKLAAWTRTQQPASIAAKLIEAGIPAAVVASTDDLIDDEHLAARAFWDAHDGGVLPSLPWQASFGRATGTAPALGADTDTVLKDILKMPDEEIAELRKLGALG